MHPHKKETRFRVEQKGFLGNLSQCTKHQVVPQVPSANIMHPWKECVAQYKRAMHNRTYLMLKLARVTCVDRNHTTIPAIQDSTGIKD